MEKITLERFDEVYALFSDAFIPSELRDYENMKQLFQKEEFLIYAKYSQNHLQGAIIVWEFDDFVFLENFAVDSKMRGQGIGSAILEDIQSHYHNHLLILEVEEPTDDLKKRRIAFYQRHQFLLNDFHYIQPTLRKNYVGENLFLMSYPQAMNEDFFQNFKKQVFQRVYFKKI